MAYHSNLSPSSAYQWFKCPASIPLKTDMGNPNQSSAASLEGTAAHGLLELCLTKGKSPEDYEGYYIHLKDGDFNKILKSASSFKDIEVTNDMVLAVESCAFYVRSRLCDLFPETFNNPEDVKMTQYAISKDWLSVEKRSNPLPDRKDTGGTADVVLDAWPEIIEVIDYKHGSGIYVDIKGNLQTRQYLLGSLGDEVYENYRHTIVQPRHYQSVGPASEDLTHEEMLAFKGDLIAACARVDDACKAAEGLTGNQLSQAMYDLGYAVAGEHCLFCPSQSNCVASRKKMEELLQMDFADTPAAINTPPDFAQLLEWAGFIKQYLRDIERQAIDHINMGGTIEGYTVTRGKGHRTWRKDISVAEVHETLVNEFGLDQESFTTLKSGPQVEAMLPKGRKADFGKLLYQPELGPRLTKVSKGKKVKSTVSDFDNEAL